MATDREFARARHEIAEICRADTFEEERSLYSLARVVQRAVPSDGWLIRGLDPGTLLPADHGVDHRMGKVRRHKGGVFQAMSKDVCRRCWEIELLERDVNKFADLARGDTHASALQIATGGRPQRSVRYREIYKKINIHDELRASLVTGSSCWGCLTLVRQRGSDSFSPAEVGFVNDVAGHIAAAFRGSARRLPPEAPRFAPMTLLLDGANRIQGITGEAEEWLQDLNTVEPGRDKLRPVGADNSVPVVVTLVAARARARATGRLGEPPFVRVQTKRKRWAEVHGAVLTGHRSAERCVAVTIHPVGQSEVSQFLFEAYGLTERERDVTSCLARGFSTKEVADSLDLSSHTVRDHVKTVFGKVGARSRGELMARIFWECANKIV